MPTNIDVAALVGDIETSTITVRRAGTTTVNDFGVASTTTTETEREAVVHPATRRQREQLPSDSRNRATIAIYTIDGALSPGTAVSGDHVLYAGRWYQVADLGDYGDLGGIYLSLAMLIDEVSP